MKRADKYLLVFVLAMAGIFIFFLGMMIIPREFEPATPFTAQPIVTSFVGIVLVIVGVAFVVVSCIVGVSMGIPVVKKPSGQRVKVSLCFGERRIQFPEGLLEGDLLTIPYLDEGDWMALLEAKREEAQILAKLPTSVQRAWVISMTTYAGFKSGSAVLTTTPPAPPS